MADNPIDLALKHLSVQRIERQINTARREKEALRNPPAVRYQGFNAAQGQPITSSGMGGKIKTNGAIEQNTQLKRTGSQFTQMPHRSRSSTDTQTHTKTGQIKSLFSIGNEFFIGSDRSKPKKILELGENQIIIAAQLENTGRGKNNFEAGILVQEENEYKLYIFKGGQKQENTYEKNSKTTISGKGGRFWTVSIENTEIIQDISRYPDYEIIEIYEERTTNDIELISFDTKTTGIETNWVSYSYISKADIVISQPELIDGIWYQFENGFATVEDKNAWDISSVVFLNRDSVQLSIDNFFATYSFANTITNSVDNITESESGDGTFDYLSKYILDINGYNPLVISNKAEKGTYGKPFTGLAPTRYPSGENKNILNFNGQEIPFYNSAKISGRHVFKNDKISFYKVNNFNRQKRSHSISSHSFAIGDSEWQDQEFEAFAYSIPDNATIYDMRYHP